MFWTFDLREQVCIFGMKVEIYAMAPFSSVLVLFDFLLVFALLCPLSGITFIDTSLQNLQIFICLHHIEIWLGNLSNYFQRCTLVTRTWPWMMVNEHRLQLSQQHGFTKEAMRKNSFKYDPLCPTIQSIHLYYQKFHEASFPPNHCCLCKLHVWKIKILYESTNMQPFHVLFVNRTTTICSTKTKPKIEPFGRLYVRRRWTTAT